MSRANYVVLVRGYPLSSPMGFLGWSTVVLLVAHDGPYLVDAGGYNIRKRVLEGLDTMGIRPAEIVGVLLTHSHFDHVENVELFPRAKVYVSSREYDYVSRGEAERVGDVYYARTHLEYIERRGRLVVVDEGEEITRGITAIGLPGHTPGSTGYLIKDSKTIVVGDAVKSSCEYNTKAPDLAFAGVESWLRSLRKVAEVADIVVPGHDAPFKVKEDEAIPLEDYAEVPLVISTSTVKVDVTMWIDYRQNICGIRRGCTKSSRA